MRVPGFDSEPERQKSVFYPMSVYPRFACQSMQACNHQMDIEVREVVARHDTLERGLDFKLDLMIQDCDIWPTWALLPGPVTHMRNPEVEMRIFDDRHGSYFGGDGSSGPVLRPLFHPPSGFFHHGPQLHVDAMVFTNNRGESLKAQLHEGATAARSLSCVLSIRHLLGIELFSRCG